MTKMLVIAFAQAFSTGAVSAAIVSKNWPVVFVSSFILNALWWYNVGHRIDLHGRKGMAMIYAGSFATGVSLGAWVWR